MVRLKAEPWYTRWSRDLVERATAIAAAMIKIKEAALTADPIPKFKGAVIRQSLSLLKSNRGVIRQPVRL